MTPLLSEGNVKLVRPDLVTLFCEAQQVERGLRTRFVVRYSPEPVQRLGSTFQQVRCARGAIVQMHRYGFSRCGSGSTGVAGYTGAKFARTLVSLKSVTENRSNVTSYR